MAKVKVKMKFLYLDDNGDFENEFEEVFVCEKSDVKDLMNDKVEAIICQRIIEDENGNLEAVTDTMFGGYTIEPYEEEEEE